MIKKEIKKFRTNNCTTNLGKTNLLNQKKSNKASTLGHKPDSQSSRTVAVNKVNGQLAVCTNDVSVTIRSQEGPKHRDSNWNDECKVKFIKKLKKAGKKQQLEKSVKTTISKPFLFMIIVINFYN